MNRDSIVDKEVFSFKKYRRELVLSSFSCGVAYIFLMVGINGMLTYVIFGILIIRTIMRTIQTTKHINSFLNRHSEDEISSLEEDLGSPYFVYSGWYILEEYMFNVDKMIRIDYKDIAVVEGMVSFIADRNQTVWNLAPGYRQTIYLEDGHKYKIFFRDRGSYSNPDSSQFVEIIKRKNPDVFVGIIEDYNKIMEDQKGKRKI